MQVLDTIFIIFNIMRNSHRIVQGGKGFVKRIIHLLRFNLVQERPFKVNTVKLLSISFSYSCKCTDGDKCMITVTYTNIYKE